MNTDHMARAAAEVGHAEAAYLCTVCYDYGVGVQKDDATAVAMLTDLVANSQFPQAYSHLAYNYRHGICVQQDKQKAIDLLVQGAKMGDLNCMYDLSRTYREGNAGVDEKTILAWLTHAANQGHLDALVYLASLHSSGELVPKDEAKAFELWQAAANEGHSMGLDNVAYCYEYGNGVQKDLKTAKQYYTKAAAAGSQYATTALQRLN